MGNLKKNLRIVEKIKNMNRIGSLKIKRNGKDATVAVYKSATGAKVYKTKNGPFRQLSPAQMQRYSPLSAAPIRKAPRKKSSRKSAPRKKSAGPAYKRLGEIASRKDLPLSQRIVIRADNPLALRKKMTSALKKRNIRVSAKKAMNIKNMTYAGILSDVRAGKAKYSGPVTRGPQKGRLIIKNKHDNVYVDLAVKKDRRGRAVAAKGYL